jgi:hypothetical protein
LQTILLGQPQFRRMLASPDLDQLRQRVLASYHLGPLTREETRAYILHRLGTAGWRGRPRWDDAAFGTVFTHSDGLPRRINRLCSRVLLYGALEETDEITAGMVETTAEELAQDLEGGGPAAPRFDGIGRELQAELQADLQTDGALTELRLRLDALEARVARRDRVFQRLLDALGTFSAGHR